MLEFFYSEDMFLIKLNAVASDSHGYTNGLGNPHELPVQLFFLSLYIHVYTRVIQEVM